MIRRFASQLSPELSISAYIGQIRAKKLVLEAHRIVMRGSPFTPQLYAQLCAHSLLSRAARALVIELCDKENLQTGCRCNFCSCEIVSSCATLAIQNRQQWEDNCFYPVNTTGKWPEYED